MHPKDADSIANSEDRDQTAPLGVLANIIIPPAFMPRGKWFSSFCSSLRRLFVRSYFHHVCRICVKVLRQSFSSGVYLSNY